MHVWVQGEAPVLQPSQNQETAWGFEALGAVLLAVLRLTRNLEEVQSYNGLLEELFCGRLVLIAVYDSWHGLL